MTLLPILLALVTVAPATAAALTEYDKLERRVGKFAAGDGESPKLLCICRSGEFSDGYVGVLERRREGQPGEQLFVAVRCAVQRFNAITEDKFDEFEEFDCAPYDVLRK